MEFVEYQIDENRRPANLHEFCGAVHRMNRKWWINPITGEAIKRNKKQMLQLMLSEISEAMEAERKSRPGNVVMDDKLPHRPGAEVEMADLVIRLADWCGGWHRNIYIEILPETIETVEDWTILTDRGEMLFDISELVVDVLNYFEPDVLYAVERYCQLCGYDLWGAVEEKLKFNLIRKDHQIEARTGNFGKAW